MPTSPPEDFLRIALISLKSSNPSLGIPKIHALLLSTYPDWTVSEKRMRKILQTEGLVIAAKDNANGTVAAGKGARKYPSSRVIPNLDLSKWTPKVEVKYFDNKKGKGLVASQDIAEGEAIWKEDPFIIAPEWEIYELQATSLACAFCTTTRSPGSSLTLSCPSSPCQAIFCSRLCLSRAAVTHPLICPGQNPASVPLLKFAKDNQWMALHALAHCTSRVLLSFQKDADQAEEDWGVVNSLAVLGMEERAKWSFGASFTNLEPDRPTWKKAFDLYVQAFKEPNTPLEKKKLAKTLKKPLPSDVDKALFEYEGFLKGLGRMSLNLEAHGGLYTLHSHLNHSCTPNVSVRHLDQSKALARITLLAKRAIPAGEELCITYVNPESGVKWRQGELEAWGFGKCTCERCVKEGKTAGEEGDAGEAGKGAANEDDGVGELERELKAGLGVL